VLKLQDGRSYPGSSGFTGPRNPVVEAALAAVPEDVRPPFHGYCAEIQCLSDALNAKENLTGSVVSTARVRGLNSQQHGTPIPPCPSCEVVLDKLGVGYK